MNNIDNLNQTKKAQRKPLPKKRSLINTKQLDSHLGGEGLTKICTQTFCCPTTKTDKCG